MEEDDILNNLDKDDALIETEVPKNTNKRDIPNNWDKTDFTNKDINPNDFKKEGKTFAIVLWSDRENIEEDILEHFIKIAKALSNRGFTFRHNGSSSNKVQNAILAIDNIQAESYLPWGKFNTNIQKPLLKYPTTIAYELAAGSRKNFGKLPPAVRALVANRFNLLLGKNCNNPCDVVIVYSKDGLEAFTKDTDFKVLGDVTDAIRICKKSNIPLFNLGKEDVLPRLSEFIKSKS